MKSYGLYESASVKIQTLKTAIEVSLSLTVQCIFLCFLIQAARMLLRVDDVVQAIRRDKEGRQQPETGAGPEVEN